LSGLDNALQEKGIDDSGNKYTIYIIKNGYISPVYKEVPDNLFAIAERTVDSITNAQGIGDLYQLYTVTKKKMRDFNLAYIPESHISKAKEFFDPVEMQALFDLGFQQASQGYPWKKSPPGME
jgi:hypothetical protein